MRKLRIIPPSGKLEDSIVINCDSWKRDDTHIRIWLQTEIDKNECIGCIPNDWAVFWQCNLD